MQSILNSEHIIFSFLIDEELTKNDYFETHKYTYKIKCHILQVKCLFKILFTQKSHKTSICKKLQFWYLCFIWMAVI